MNNRLIWAISLTLIFIIIDVYAFQSVKTSTQHLSSLARKFWHTIYWSISFITFGGIILLIFIGFENISSSIRNFSIAAIFGLFISKLLISLFLLIDDIIRAGKWIVHLFYNSKLTEATSATDLSRSEFISKTGLIVATIPIITMTQGIVYGAYDYKIRKQKIQLKNLPKAFHGLKIAQISDIHSGSFFNKKAVERGVEMLLNEKPDMVFFTGDIVNNKASEMKDYAEVFAKVKAPMGVYSVLGNHDYGDYVAWSSQNAKMNNLHELISIQKQMGWDILINEHRIIQSAGEKLAILGIEHWGAKGNFPKYGKMKQAHTGTEEAAVKLLLSHDPSHWRAQVLRDYQDVDITFSGHTHGFQFGIETEFLRWSPVQYVYNEWAGLYQEKDQYLYVNRGFGFIGFPGRIGILPEITLIELENV